MKLHLETKLTLLNTPPSINPIMHQDLFIYYSIPYLIICNATSLVVLHKFKYEDVQVIKIHEDHLYVCTSQIYKLDLVKFELVDTIKLSKALINKIVFYKQCTLISKIDHRLSLYRNGKKIYETVNDQFCEDVFLNDKYSGYFDKEKAVLYTNDGSKVYEYQSDCIVSVGYSNEQLYLICANGSVLEMISKTFNHIKVGIQSAICTESGIFAIFQDKLFKISYSGVISESCDINELISKHSGCFTDYYFTIKEELILQHKDKQHTKRIKIEKETQHEFSMEENNIGSDNTEYEINEINNSYSDENETDSNNMNIENQSDNSNIEESNQTVDLSKEEHDIVNDLISDEEECSMLEFSILSSEIIKTCENSYLILSNNEIVKIITFLADMTDSVIFNNHLIVSTTSGYINSIDHQIYTQGEYLSNTKIINIHKDTITSMYLCNNVLVTGSDDGTIIFTRLCIEKDTLLFTKIYEMSGFSSTITAIVYNGNILAVATRDCILQLFKGYAKNNKHCDFDLATFLNSFENISTQKLHAKQINHISLLPNCLVTSSSDKTAKVLDFNGTTLKTISSEKVLSSSFNAKYLAICTAKGAKLFHNPSLSPITGFQSKRPVLASCFYKNYFITISDIIRVYDIDKKKCVKSYDMQLKNCWSFTFPFACAENKIIQLADVSDETHRKQVENIIKLKECTILFDRFVSEHKYKEALEVALQKSNDSMLFQVLCAAYETNKNLDFLVEFIKGDQIAKLVDVLIKNSGLKFSEVVSAGINMIKEKKIDKERKQKLFQIIKRHNEAVDEIFIEISSLKLYNR